MQLIFLLIALTFFCPWPAQAEEEIVLNTPGQAPLHYPDQSGLLDRFMRGAFARLGLRARLQWLPPERALVNANEGIEDGDVGRITGLTAQYPNLLQVPESIYTGDFVAITRGLRFPVDGWGALVPYHVGTIIGHKITEGKIKDVKSHTRAEGVEQLITLLALDRIEVAVVEKRFGWAEVQRQGVPGAIILTPPVASAEFFVYLHKRHAALVTPLAKALTDLKADSTYDRILESFPLPGTP